MYFHVSTYPTEGPAVRDATVSVKACLSFDKCEFMVLYPGNKAAVYVISNTFLLGECHIGSHFK